MTRPAPFRAASLAMTLLVIVMTCFGHLYARAQHDHGRGSAIVVADLQTEQRMAAPDEAASAAGLLDQSACGCCFSGCGCCSTAFGPALAQLAPSGARALRAPRPDFSQSVAGLRPAELFRPPRLLA